MPIVHIVDDAPAILQVTERGLSRFGYEVRTFSSALGYLDEEPAAPDVLIVDLMMSGMNGVAFCEHLRQDQRYNRVPIIAIVASAERTASMNDQTLAREYGVRSVVTKPFALRDLRAAVDAAMTPAPAPKPVDAEFEVTFNDEGAAEGTIASLLLVGFAEDRLASLEKHVDLLTGKKISIVDVRSVGEVEALVRRQSEVLKLVVIDTVEAPNRSDLFDPEALRKLTNVSNVALAFLGVQSNDLSPELHVIRAGDLHGDDLAAGLVDWLGLQERMSVRVMASGTVRIRIGEAVGEGELVDVSEGGLRIQGVRSGVLTAPGVGASISFSIAGYGDINETASVIRWLRPADDGTVACGIAFSRPVDSAVKELLATYIKEAQGHEKTVKFAPIFRGH